MMARIGVLDWVVTDSPIAVIDLETTGLLAGGDKIVEVAVVRLEPGRAPTLVLDTLINPHRPVTATEIHGITDDDVVGAPGFEEVAGNIAAAMQDAVMVSYNVYFDARFLGTEFSQAGLQSLPAHVCLMYMGPLLELGKRCTLEDACRSHGVDHAMTHHAATDALASAKLWQFYTTVFASRGVHTFADMGKLKSYKFMQSFGNPLLDESAVSTLPRTSRLKPRSHEVQAASSSPTAPGRVHILGEYWDGLMTALSDLDLSDTEIDYLSRKQRALGLQPDEVRWIHGRTFSGVLGELSQDKAITMDEAEVLWRIAGALRRLGWAPGDPVPTTITSKPPELSIAPKRGLFASLFGRR
jgi:DNA polymerase III epsilon subunit family exonuclease